MAPSSRRAHESVPPASSEGSAIARSTQPSSGRSSDRIRKSARTRRSVDRFSAGIAISAAARTSTTASCSATSRWSPTTAAYEAVMSYEKAVKVDPAIFKAYDVRGVYPAEVNEETARAIGAAFVAYLHAKRVAVGRDMRLSSPALAAAFIDGATSQGADVTDYGMIATDMLYFAVARDGHDGGVQITASHNPKQYNGMKMVRREAFPLSGDEGLAEIREMIGGDSIPAPARRRGAITTKNALDEYVDHVMSFIDPSIVRPFNVVLDAGSGMGGLVAPELFKRLPCQTTRLCFEIDGTFPNHEANPLIEENRRDITEAVIKQKADIGIAWDGDADRCFFIDGTGEFISGDFITALLAQAFLLKQPGATIIYDLRASHAVRDIVAAHVGKALMNRVGHALIKRRMRATNAVLRGEATRQ